MTGGLAWRAIAPGSGGERAPPPGELEVTSRAIEFYEAKYQANGGHPIFGHRLLDLYGQRFAGAADLSDVRRAESIARELLERVTEPARVAAARARLSSLRLTQHDFEGAYREAREAVAIDDSDVTRAAWFDAALAVGDEESAAQALSGMESGGVPWLLRAARLDEVEGRAADAAARLERAYARLFDSAAPRQTVAWVATRLADLSLAEGRDDAAVWWRRRALEISPGYRGAIEGLADLAYAEGRWADAREGYEAILAAAHPDLYLRVAEASHALGEPAVAAAYEARFLSVVTEPGAEALYAHPLAIYYARSASTRDLALAIIERDLARRSPPESEEVLAWIRLERGEPALALRVIEALAERGRLSPDGRYIRGRALQDLDRGDEAAADLAAVSERPALLSHHLLLDLRGVFGAMSRTSSMRPSSLARHRVTPNPARPPTP